ncbi:MAG: hypothetical protein R3F30_01520 [Planctomycetota bacterium]
MRARLSLALAVLAAPALAQTTSYTVPYGLDSIEGNQVFYHWAGGRVMQVADMSNPKPRAINQLSFRRNNAAYSSATKGTLDVVVTMAQCDWSLLDTVFKGNWQTNVVEVLNAKSVNIPDWTTAPTTPPAAFDFTLKFAKTWVYRGQTALVWTVDYANSTAGTHTMDRDYGAYVYNAGTSLGSGCGNWVDYMRFWNTGPSSPVTGFHMQVAGTSGPANMPVFMMLDGTDSNLSVPGLCAKLHALPTFIFYLGLNDASGNLSHRYVTLPWVGPIQGGTIYTQLLAPDASQTGIKLAVSGGQKVLIPTNSATANSHPTMYAWASGSGATTATSNYIFFGGAPVAELK